MNKTVLVYLREQLTLEQRRTKKNEQTSKTIVAELNRKRAIGGGSRGRSRLRVGLGRARSGGSRGSCSTEIRVASRTESNQ